MSRQVIRLFICETENVFLHTNQLYIFSAHENCKRCKQLEENAKLPRNNPDTFTKQLEESLSNFLKQSNEEILKALEEAGAPYIKE